MQTEGSNTRKFICSSLVSNVMPLMTKSRVSLIDRHWTPVIKNCGCPWSTMYLFISLFCILTVLSVTQNYADWKFAGYFVLYWLLDKTWHSPSLFSPTILPSDGGIPLVCAVWALWLQCKSSHRSQPCSLHLRQVEQQAWESTLRQTPAFLLIPIKS